MRTAGEVVKGSLPKGASKGWNHVMVVIDSLIRGKIIILIIFIHLFIYSFRGWVSASYLSYYDDFAMTEFYSISNNEFYMLSFFLSSNVN